MQLMNPEMDYPATLNCHAQYAQHSSYVTTGMPAPHVTTYHSPTHHVQHQAPCQQQHLMQDYSRIVVPLTDLKCWSRGLCPPSKARGPAWSHPSIDSCL